MHTDSWAHTFNRNTEYAWDNNKNNNNRSNLPVTIQDGIYVGRASRLIVSPELDFSFGCLTQYPYQYKANDRQHQTRQQFDYYAECPKVDAVFCRLGGHVLTRVWVREFIAGYHGGKEKQTKEQ